MIEATPQPRLCQVRSQTDLPCGRPAVTTLLGVRFCERCAREQEDYFTVGELTQVPRGKSGVTEGVGSTARVPRSGRTAEPQGRPRVPAAKSVKAILLLAVISISLLASAACGGGGQAHGGPASAEAKVERETKAQERTQSAEATAQGKGTHGTSVRVGDAAREEGNKAHERNDVGGEHLREDRSREIYPEELTLKVDGEPGTEFSGVCSLGKEEKIIEGRVPDRHVFEPGDAGLECEIRKEGGSALEVVVAGDGIRSSQRSSGTGEGTVRFAFSEDSISSSTSFISLNQISASSDRSSSNDPQ